MLKSMTGYGRGECPFEDGSIVVEVKSVNHRHLDVSCRMPKRFASLENQARKTISTRFSRGRFDVFTQSDLSKGENRGFELNLPLAQQYYSILQELRDKLNLSGHINLDLLAGVRDIIVVKEIEPEQEEEEEKAFGKAFNDALDSLERMREVEGENLCRDILEKLDNIEAMVKEIRIRSPQVLTGYRERLARRVKELNDGFDVDAQRLNQEIAFLAERSDITEELVRIGSHLDQFGAIMKMGEPMGRKLDFLIQEINREINTIASKANDAHISQKVVEIKGEVEKIREQVQNVE